MSDKKFDLNKFLQLPKLFTPIDYSGITVPSVSETQEVVQNFEDWRKSQGYKTEEEKQEDLKAEMQAAQQRFNDQDLWNSEDPYEVYNTYQTDPEKQAEFQRNGQMVAGIGSIIATLPFTAGMTGGWAPAIVSTATGVAGGHAGAYGGQKLGQHLDDKYGWNTTPYLSTIGGLAGGILGGGLGYKGWEGATNQYLINKAFKSGQLKWGQPTSYTAYHQSATPITKFKFPFKRWDVRTHGADPNGAFFTVGEPAAAGFLAERPYTGQFHVKVQKPLIQTGELSGPTKNGLRNAIVRRARKNGADAVFFDGIADNQLQNQQILFAMDNADIGYRGMVGTPFKQGNWQLAKGVRNPSFNGKAQIMWMGPTAGKTTYSKINPNVIDIDPLTKGIRKSVAKKLGLNFKDPAVSATPEYQEAIVNDLVKPWLTDPANRGKTLVASTKHLLDPKYKIKFANEPFIPDFETFVARNQARGFRETPEQLRKWYDSILEIKPDIKIDNRFASEILNSPIKGSHTFHERPSTYFKDAIYAGTPGTYAGKEVPTWQLPRGQRNQPHNPTATERIYSVLGRDPNVQTGGINLSNLADTPQNQTLLSMRDFLGKHGVDTKNITLDDLESLYRKRLSSIKATSNDNYNLALPQGEGAFPKKWEIRAFDQEGLVGRMSTAGPTRKQPDMLPEIWEKYHKSHPGASVDMIENATRMELGSKKIPTRSSVKGVSQRLYDAGIPVAQQTNNGQGLMSGEMYLQPQRSTSVMKHYPSKRLIRNNGEWHWENLDPTKVTTKNNPVYLLSKPSGAYEHVPTKSSSFFPSAIKDGQITTNINHGSIFLEEGGKVNPQQ